MKLKELTKEEAITNATIIATESGMNQAVHFNGKTYSIHNPANYKGSVFKLVEPPKKPVSTDNKVDYGQKNSKKKEINPETDKQLE